MFQWFINTYEKSFLIKNFLSSSLGFGTRWCDQLFDKNLYLQLKAKFILLVSIRTYATMLIW